MAEVACRRCGKEVSSRLIACPNCGEPVGYVASLATATPVSAAPRPIPDLRQVLQATPPRAQRLPPFRPLRFWAAAAILGLALVAASVALAIPADLEQIDQARRLNRGEPVTATELIDNDNRLNDLALVYLAALVVSAVAYSVWIYRAHSNLVAFGASSLNHTPRRAVGAFFVPLVSLWRPYQVVSEIWRASKSSGGSAWRDEPNNHLIGPWWLLWLSAAWVGQLLLGRVVSRPESFGQLQTYAYVLLAFDLLILPAAVLAGLIVWQLTQRQEQRAGSGPAASFEDPAPAERWTNPTTEPALRLGAAVVAIAAATAVVFVLDRATNDELAVTSASESASSRVLLSRAASYLSANEALPGFTQADPRLLGVSNADLGLGRAFSESVVFSSEQASQVMVAYMTVASSQVEIAGIKAYLRDRTALERELGVGAPDGPRGVQWSEPAVGDSAVLGRFEMPAGGLALSFEFLIFIEQNGEHAAVVFVQSYWPAGSRPVADAVGFGRAIESRIAASR